MPNERTKRNLDRRSFLRKSGVAAGMTAVAPLASAITQAQLGNALSRTADPSRFGARDDSVQEKPAAIGPSLSRQFARWVAALRYDDLPAPVVDRLKGFSLHGLSSALLGSQLPQGKEALKLVLDDEAAARNGATVMVNGAKATKSGAAFANSEMIYAGGKLDSFRMLTHPGTTILPCALVAAETQAASGKEFLTGIAAGYEVMERMAADFIQQ